MSSMPLPVLIDRPPLSKVSPLRTRTSGAAPAASSPACSSTIKRGSSALPCDTPSSALKPCSASSAGPSTRLCKAVRARQIDGPVSQSRWGEAVGRLDQISRQTRGVAEDEGAVGRRLQGASLLLRGVSSVTISRRADSGSSGVR